MSGNFTARSLLAGLGLCLGTTAVQAQFGCNPYPYAGPVVYFPYPVQPMMYWGPPAVAVAAAPIARPATQPAVAQAQPERPPTRAADPRPAVTRPTPSRPAEVRPTEYALPQVAQPTPAIPPPAPTESPRVEVETPRIAPISPAKEPRTAPVNPLVIPLGPTETPAQPATRPPAPVPEIPRPTPAQPAASGGFTIPSIAPKSSSEGSPKLPPLKLPTSPAESASFFRPAHAERPVRVDVFPVAGDFSDRATVGVFNYTEQEIEFTIGGKQHRLPARHCVCLESASSEIDWQVNQQPGQQTQLPQGAKGVEIVIRP